MIRAASVLAVAIAATVVGAAGGASRQEAPYEVWAIDQADTTADGGGTLFVYDGAALAGQAAATATSERIDLGGAARTMCLTQTGTAPRRPHMLAFNKSETHGIIAFVATGHVLFVDARTRNPVACIDAGAQAHAAFPSPDERYVIVANQNGKLLQRISTSYATGTFALDNAAQVNLATCTTPSGARCEDAALRPDNAPICPVIDSNSRFVFVTLRGGGLLVVDGRTSPMAIVAEYDRSAVHPNGCGGVENAGKMFITSGGGTPANPVEWDLYSFPMSGFTGTPTPPNTPAPSTVLSRDGDNAFVDAHGAVLTRETTTKKTVKYRVRVRVRVKTKKGAKPRYRTVVRTRTRTVTTKHGPFLWIADRAANNVTVIDPRTSQGVGQFLLAGQVSSDPAPDLLAISPSGNRVFAALRGPAPLTANAPGVNNAVGTTPGVGVIRVEQNGRTGVLQAVAPISKVVAGVETADPHAIGVRRK